MKVSGTDLPRSFFARDAETVARDLLGCLLVRRSIAGERLCRVVETEAYVGPHDLACHAAKGRTPRTETMFGPAGRAYVYFVYGMHHLLNVVTGEPGDPQAVLLRGVEPWPSPTFADRSLAGPAKLCKVLDIETSRHDGLDVCAGGEIAFRTRLTEPPETLGVSVRIGVDYAGEWASRPLRFYLRGAAGVSGRRALRV